VNERKRRVAENEALFRSVNEQIDRLAGTVTVPTDELAVVCECGTATCTDRIRIAQPEYTRIRADSTLFVLKPGHDDPESETVVERGEAYWTVRKDPGTSARIAESLAER
jgi:hypothetical protein